MSQFDAALHYLNTLVVWRLDRLGRSLPHPDGNVTYNG
jgi:DNA invertase Pin-like site-specific DNA recombinase